MSSLSFLNEETLFSLSYKNYFKKERFDLNEILIGPQISIDVLTSMIKRIKPEGRVNDF